ncbi:MAG TPA: acyl carrier protein [Kribbellaceae bacterium]
MPGLPPPGRSEVVAMLASMGERTPDQVRERIDSMELAWLVHQVEQKYGVQLDDEQLDRMTTLTDAVTVLHETVARHG